MSIEVVMTERGGRRYKVRLRDPAGREYSRRFRTRREAETFVATERADRARGLWDGRHRKYVRVERWANDWLDAHPAPDPIDRLCDRVILERYINPAIGQFVVSEVTPREVRRLVDEWRMSLGYSYARRPYAVLQAIFDAAADAGLIEYSPCE